MKIYFETYGCSLNFSDTDIMKSILKRSVNAEFVNSFDEADISVLNTCIVKGPTEYKMLRRINALKSKPLIVTGCLAEALPEKVEHYSIVGTENLDKIDKAVLETLNGNQVRFIGDNPNIISSFFGKLSHNKVVDIIPISRGCLGNCTYCITKFARKSLKSYDISLIVNEIRKSVNNGIKEIWLTSEDMSCYGLDKGTNIVNLINEIAKQNLNEDDVFIRMGMFNPAFLKKYVREIHLPDFFFKFFHVPVQSGNDRILKLMNRGYSSEEALNVFKELRKDTLTTIATDVIVGFPTESDDEFQDTVRFIKEIEPDVLNISRFWLREKTEANSFKQLPGHVTKERSRIVTKLHDEISWKRNQLWVGWHGNALVDEIHSDFVTARNQYYKPIVIYGLSEDYLGKVVQVKITEARTHFLVGKTI